MKIQTTQYGQPILEIKKGTSAGKQTDFGVFRERNPNRDWGEVQSTNMEIEGRIVSIELTPELKLTLLGDLAYVYGNRTRKFEEKVKEFKLI